MQTDNAININLNEIDSSIEWTFLLNADQEIVFLFPFWEYLERLHSYFELLVHDIPNTITQQSLRTIICTHMKIILLDLIKRSLIWEFNLSKKKHPNLTIKAFLLNVAGKNQLEAFFKKYPVLEALLERGFSHYRLYITKLFHRLKSDLIELSSSFNLNGYELQALSILGDAHCLGNRVAELIFYKKQKNKSKKIIYKPRDLNQEKNFNEFLKFINKTDEGLTLKPVAVLPKYQYGWMEHIEQESIHENIAHKYYNEFGMLLGVCSILNGQDLHFENLIAAGQHPIIIDLECLFTPSIPAYDQTDREPSIFDTLLIPYPLNESRGAYDFSATLNHANQESFMRRFEVKGDYLTDVYVVRSIVNIEPVKNMLVNRLTGIPISATEYCCNIVDGYQRFMYWMIQNKENVTEFIVNNFSNLKSRVLFRPTFVYSKVLVESYHPKLLSNFKHYYEHCAQLYKESNPVYKSIYADELFDLLNGDIPYFSALTSDIALKNSRGESVSLVSHCSGMDLVVDKINSLDTEYVINAVNQILISLKGRYA